MKIFGVSFIGLMLCLASSALPLIEIDRGRVFSTAQNDLLNEWSSFKGNHRKTYRNSSSELNRFSIFQQNILKINKQNVKFHNGLSTFTAGINRFSDWTEQEFANYVNKGYKSQPRPNNSVLSKVASLKIPSSVDWRTQGYLNPIKDQGTCGSCWGFAAACAMESYNFKTNGVLPDLSEQNLVDCVYLSQGYTGIEADGCQGGIEDDAYNYVKANGIATQNSYPYSSAVSGVWSGKCKYNSTMKSNVQVSGFTMISNGKGNETALHAALASIGPLDVALYVSSSFQSYQSGVFVDSTCGNNSNPINPNHAVNLVGYGTLNGQDYYILRNQWGTSWGIQGYMYFKRDPTGNTNQCGIASWAIYPNIKQTSPVTSKSTSTVKTTVKTTSKAATASQNTSTAKTSRGASTSTPKLVTNTTSSPISWKAVCTKGAGWYTSNGCQTVNYCRLSITNYYCNSGYLYDAISETCKLASQVKCGTPVSACANGSGYYPLAGCQYVDYCQQSFTAYYCASGYLFDVTTNTCGKASLVKCSV